MLNKGCKLVMVVRSIRCIQTMLLFIVVPSLTAIRIAVATLLFLDVTHKIRVIERRVGTKLVPTSFEFSTIPANQGYYN